MAATITVPRRAAPLGHWLKRPLSVHGTELAPNLLLMAKLVVLAMMLQPEVPLSRHFLPFLRFFDDLGSPAAFHATLLAVFWIAGVALLFNVRVREMCCVLGLTILVSLLASRAMYSNNFLYCGALLLMLGLERPGRNPWLLRAQVFLLYFGAGTNKLLEADWRSGQFFEYWYGRSRGWYMGLTHLLPPLALSRLLSWGAFCTELGIAAMLLLRRAWPLAIFTILAFHTALLVVTGSTYHLFFYAASAATLAFVSWPAAPVQVAYDEQRPSLLRLLHAYERSDVERAFVLQPQAASSSAALQVSVGSTLYINFRALKALVLYNPLTYFALLLVLVAPDVLHVRRWIALLALLALSPVTNPLGEFLFQRWIRTSQAAPWVHAAGRVA